MLRSIRLEQDVQSPYIANSAFFDNESPAGIVYLQDPPSRHPKYVSLEWQRLMPICHSSARND